MFKTIGEEYGSVLYIENASIVQVKWEVSVEIEFTLEKTLTFKDVCFMFMMLGTTWLIYFYLIRKKKSSSLMNMKYIFISYKYIFEIKVDKSSSS